MWSVRKKFWNAFAVFKFRRNKPVVFPIPEDTPTRIQTVPFSSKYPSIPVDNIVVADHVPKDEVAVARYYFYQFQVWMYRVFSPMQAGLPQIDKDAHEALAEAYTAKHRKCFPPPTLPMSLEGDVDLGLLAVQGPFTAYLEKVSDGEYQWDLRDLSNYEHHKGLHLLGVKVLFRVEPSSKSLQPYQIESELGVHGPADRDWALAKRIALCAISNHTSLVRHYNWVHLSSGAPFAISTRNNFPGDHPLRRLLWPHMFGSQNSNLIVSKGQMAKGGDFETCFSFTHKGMCHLFAETYLKFPIITCDPEREAAEHGVDGADFDTPTLDNLKNLFDVMCRHVDRYLRHYYESDEALRSDQRLSEWLEELEKLIPNGIGKVVGDDVNFDSLSRLMAGLIYIGTVQHELLGTHLWNYQLWIHKLPARVYKNGNREPLDVYQRLVNANFNLNVRRRKLLDDFSYLGLDPDGVKLLKQFQDELRELDEHMTREGKEVWKIYPANLEANMNA